MTFPKSGKIKVTPEQSRIVQERLFREGYRWRASGSEISHIKSEYLFWKPNRITHDDDLEIFNQTPRPEYTMSLFVDEVKEDDVFIQFLEDAETKDLTYLKTKYNLTRK